MIGVACVNAEDAKECADELEINYAVLIDDNEKVSNLYGPVESIPTIYLIDREGKVVKIYTGFTEKDELESDINDLLK